MAKSQLQAKTTLHRGKYTPESFTIPGQDSNGNSVRVYCRIIPLLDRAIDIVLGQKKFPFKTKGDLLRWCVKRGVDQLEGMEPVGGSVLIQVDAMMDILRDEELNHAFMTVFHTMEHTVSMHIQAQAMGEARRVVTVMKAQIQKMEAGYWRNRYLKELDNKFGHLTRGSGGAKFGDTGDFGPDHSGADEDE